MPLISRVWDPVLPDAEPLIAIPERGGRVLDGIEEMPWIPGLWVREVLNESGLIRERLQRHVHLFTALVDQGPSNFPGRLSRR